MEVCKGATTFLNIYEPKTCDTLKYKNNGAMYLDENDMAVCQRLPCCLNLGRPLFWRGVDKYRIDTCVNAYSYSSFEDIEKGSNVF